MTPTSHTSVLRFLLLPLCCLLASTASMAQRLGEWQVYPSFTSATESVVAGEKVFANMDGNLLSVDLTDTEVRTYPHMDMLHGVDISHMAWSAQAGRLILVYTDSNIDLLSPSDDQVVNMASLQQSSLSGKEVNSVYVDGATAYVATGFGFLILDLKEATFRTTVQLGMNVHSLTLFGAHLYASTPSGLYRCALSGNMLNRSEWELMDQTEYFHLATVGNRLVGARRWGLYELKPGEKGTTVSGLAGGVTRHFSYSGSTLVWGTADQIWFGKDLSSLTTVSLPAGCAHITTDGRSTFWSCEGARGLKAYTYKDGSLKLSQGPYQSNSPVRDLAWRIHWEGDRLLVAGGINTTEAIFFPPTAMTYQGGQWTNFQEMEQIPEQYPNLQLANTTHLVQDPQDSTHHFASLHRNGLCEYRDGKFVKLYNSDNSPLRPILPNSKNYYNYVACSGLQYDTDGNLWMLCSMTDTVVRFIQPDGKWGALYYPELKGISLCDDYLMHSSGLRFIVSRRLDGQHGIFCFDTNGTLNTVRDDRHRLRTTIINQDETAYAPDEYYCLDEDLDGRIWVGTSQGLFVITLADEFFDDDFRYEQIKINRNDGSGLADYLLSGVSISCIATDPAGRHWIGTHQNGLYLISADGQQLIHHFMSDNSPLLSNNVQSVAVHTPSGLVMIATDLGLCSYMSDATKSVDQMKSSYITVYPNPVRPDYDGPIVVRGLSLNAEVKILSATGQLVWSGISTGGTFTWNGRGKNGKRVASGIYHIVANNDQGKNAIVARVMIIR